MKQATNKQLRAHVEKTLGVLEWETNRIDTLLSVLFMLERELKAQEHRQPARVVESIQLALLDSLGELETLGRSQLEILKGSDDAKN